MQLGNGTRLLLVLAIVLAVSAALPMGAGAAPNLDDFWAGTAHWVLDAQNIGSSLSMGVPCMLWVGNQIYCYYDYIIWTPSPGQIGTKRAHSTDGINWTDDGWALIPGSWLQYSWSAQSLYHQLGRADGDGWSANMAQDPQGMMCYGPYTTVIPPGPMDGVFQLMIDNNTSDNANVVYIDVNDATTGQVLASATITRRQFTGTYTYQLFHLNFAPSGWNHQIELRTYYYDTAYIKEGLVGVAEQYYPHWDIYCAAFPSVVLSNGVYYMTYEGIDYPYGGTHDDVGLAMCTDGISFRRNATYPILSHNPSIPWENACLGVPRLRLDGSTWTMYYSASNSSSPILCQEGVATGTNLLALTKSANNPIIRTAAGTWESGTVGRASTQIQCPSGYYYMAYEGSTAYPYDTAYWSTGLARSSDKMNWTKYSGNPVVPQVYSYGNDCPEMIVINGDTYLYVTMNLGFDRLSRYKLVWN